MAGVSIRELEKGKKYLLLASVGSGKDRRRPQKIFQGTRRQAEIAAAEFLVALARGTYVEPTKTTVSEWINQYAEEMKRDWSTRTYDITRRYNRLYIEPTALGHTALTDVTPTLLKAWKSTLQERFSSQTCLNAYAVVNSAFNEAVRMEIIFRNPLAAVRRPKVERKQTVTFSIAQLIQIEEAVHNTDMEVPVVLAIRSGMRVSEICALQWRDVTFENEHAVIRVQRSFDRVTRHKPHVRKCTKTGKSRPVTLDTEVSLLLVRHKEHQRVRLKTDSNIIQKSDTFVCIGQKYTYLHPHTLSHQFAELLVEIGLKEPGLHFQALRATHDTLLADSGFDRYQLGRRLGHSPRVAEEHYIGEQRRQDTAMSQAFLKMLQEERAG